VHCIESGTILTSAACLAEIEEVLSRKKFDAYLTFEERSEFFKRYVELVVPVHPVSAISACRDPKDDKFLSLAIAGVADYLITGDQDLRVLHPFRGVSILSPGAFLRSLIKK